MTASTTAPRAAWAAAAAASGLLLLSFLRQPLGPMGPLLAAVAAITAFRPYEPLLVIAAFVPLSTILSVVLGADAAGLRLVEAIALAYLTGWTARRTMCPGSPVVSPAFRWSAAGLMVAALASAVVSGARILTEIGGAPTGLIDDWWRAYPVTLDATAFALLFGEGVLLAWAVGDTCAGSDARRNGLIRMVVVAAAAAASFNLLRLVIDGALPRQQPWREFVNLLLHTRVNVHHTDMNAAGSYFALAWFLALGLAVRQRIAGVICLVLVSAGLWTVGSRVAIAATLITAAAILVFRMAGGQLRRATALALCGIAVLACAVLLWFPLGRHVASPSLALRIRLALAGGAIAMAADHPIFGVGLGEFYGHSEPYVGVPNYIVRENAHNNFLQVLAELGVPGLWLFLVVIGVALAAARAGPIAQTWPIVAGVSAFLLTCLGGHPLLVPLAAMPFWIVLGVAASWPVTQANAAYRTIAAALTVLFIVSLPSRTAAGIRSANMANTSFGLSSWQRQRDGVRFRWGSGRSTFYVPSAAKAVTIPLRHGDDAPYALQIRVLLDGREATRILVPARGEWTTVTLVLPANPARAFTRVDLEAGPPDAAPFDLVATNEAGILMVGRPEIHP